MISVAEVRDHAQHWTNLAQGCISELENVDHSNHPVVFVGYGEVKVLAI